MNLPSEDIKDMLVSFPLSLVHKTNLFIGFEPDIPKNCVTIYDTPGFSPLNTLDKGEEVFRPSIQIKVRNTGYVAGGDLINDIKSYLHNVTKETWNGAHYILIQCSQEPFCLGFTQDGLSQWVCNFEIQRQ